MDMKKTISLLLFSIVTVSTLFAQDKSGMRDGTVSETLKGMATSTDIISVPAVKSGDLIYGTVTDSNGPVAGIIVIERNANNRIMAQATTDENGNYSFRMVNPDNELCVLQRNQKRYNDFNSVILPLRNKKNDIKLDKKTGVDEKLQDQIVCLDIISNPAPKDYYIPFRDYNHYYSIEELFNNMYLYF